MNKSRRDKDGETAGFIVFFVVLVFLFVSVAVVQAADPQEKKVEVIQTEIGLDQIVEGERKVVPAVTVSEEEQGRAAVEFSAEEQQIIAINKSLKNALEENQRLTQEKMAAEEELGGLRGQSEIRANRINFLTRQKEDLTKQTEEAKAREEARTKELQELKSALEQKEKEYQDKLKKIQDEIAQKEQEQKKAMETVLPRTKAKGEKDSSVPGADLTQIKKQTAESLTHLEENIKKVAYRVAQVNQENKRLKTDSAKLHYNLANTFFGQGQYEKAAREYKKVIQALPYDAAAHYNLAFVCGEFLNDYKTALEHYEQYLFLNPYAEDESAVREKILEAQLNLRTRINSPIDKEISDIDPNVKHR